MSKQPHDVTELRIRSYAPRDRDWVLMRHIRHYEEGEGFDGTFRAAVERALDAYEQRPLSSRSHAIVVEGAERPMGCVFCTADDPDTARIRLFYVEPELRGRGCGASMLEHIRQHARTSGYAQLVVSTFDRHRAACALYRSRGFRLEHEVAMAAFGQQLVKLDFRLDLRAG